MLKTLAIGGAVLTAAVLGLAGLLFVKLDQTETSLAAATVDLQETASALDTQTVANGALELSLAATTADLRETASALDTQTAANGALELSLAATTADLRETASALDTQTAANSALELSLAATTADLRETASALDTQTAANSALELSLAATTADLRETASALDTQTVANSALELSLAATTADLRETASALDTQTVANVDLEAANAGLLSDKEGIEAQLDGLGDRYSELLLESGTVEDLRIRASTLRNEITDLEERLRPLILASESTWTVGFACTGSMEPVLTCLDRATYRTDFQPEDVVVGATIYFSPNCWGADFGAVHRVAGVRVTEDGYEYWPKGDGNDEPDGCWVPYADVRSYIIEIHKNVVPENAELRDNVNAARAAYVAARDAYDVVLERYYDPARREWSFPSRGAYTRARAAYDRVVEAQDYWECWVEAALEFAQFGFHRLC